MPENIRFSLSYSLSYILLYTDRYKMTDMEKLIWNTLYGTAAGENPFALGKKVLAGSSFSGSVLLDQCWWINIAGLLFNNISALRENLSPFTSEYHYPSVWESCSPGSSRTFAMLATRMSLFSSWFKLISFTPEVILPSMEIPDTAVRIIIPSVVIIITS